MAKPAPPPAPEPRDWGKIAFTSFRFVLWIAMLAAGYYFGEGKNMGYRRTASWMLYAVGAVGIFVELGLLFFVGASDPIKKLEREQTKAPKSGR